MNDQRTISSILAERFSGLRVMPGCEDEIREKIKKAEREELEKRVVDTRKNLGIPAWWTVDNFEEARWPEMASWLVSGDTKRNLLIVGPTNMGKSHAACALAMRAASERELSVYRLREHAFYPLWDQARYHESDMFRDVVAKAKRADILVYDDLGKVEITKGTEYALTPFGCVLFDIFDERAERRKVNYVTTRYPSFDLLKKAVGEDFIRRVLQREGDDASRGKIIAYKKAT
jgi:DNA replication protein DnaC